MEDMTAVDTAAAMMIVDVVEAVVVSFMRWNFALFSCCCFY